MGDAMENLDDIMKQMNKEFATDIADRDVTLEPRIVQQKEDVLYIKNPGFDWGFNQILNLTSHDVSALTISLQEKQAIALLLRRQEGLTDSQGITQAKDFKVNLNWGAVQTATGLNIQSTEDT